MTAPAIGSLFTYNGRQYRLTNYICKAPRPPIAGDDVLSQVLREIVESEGPPRMSLTFCAAGDATHVAGQGVAGCVAPIAEIEVTGMVAWSPEMIAQDVAQAKRLEGQGLY